MRYSMQHIDIKPRNAGFAIGRRVIAVAGVAGGRSVSITSVDPSSNCNFSSCLDNSRMCNSSSKSVRASSLGPLVSPGLGCYLLSFGNPWCNAGTRFQTFPTMLWSPDLTMLWSPGPGNSESKTSPDEPKLFEGSIIQTCMKVSYHFSISNFNLWGENLSGNLSSFQTQLQEGSSTAK